MQKKFTLKKTTAPNSTPSEELYRFGADGNLRLYSYDRLFFALYGYDGGTTRTYKYSFDLNPNWVNGRLENVSFNPHPAMFYPNSYLNFNQDGHYTKHYYNGMERIASRLGDQNLPIHTHDPELQDRKDWQDSLIRKNIVEITGYEFLEPGEEQNPEDPKPVFELPQVGLNNLTPNTSSVYYYHPNHLGSTCYVTDGNATVVQGFLYAPFGEITNEYNNSFGSSIIPKYSFNAKELDEETGMYYYEARYYAPPTFISRDVLFEEKPWFTPYHYCSNNPVVRVDPSGMDDYEIDRMGVITLCPNQSHAIEGKDRLIRKPTFGHAKFDENGMPKTAFVEAEKGTFGENNKSKHIGRIEVGALNYEKDDGSIGVAYPVLISLGDQGKDKAFEIFNFLAKNTKVEWSLIGVNKPYPDDSKYTIVSSRLKHYDFLGAELAGKMADKNNLSIFIHNHHYYKWASDTDKTFLDNHKNTKATIGIYLPLYEKYYNYSGEEIKIK